MAHVGVEPLRRRIELVEEAPVAVLVGSALLPRLEDQRHVERRQRLDELLLRVGVEPVFGIDGQDHPPLGHRQRHADPARRALLRIRLRGGDGLQLRRRVVLQRGDAVERILVGGDGVTGRIGIEGVGHHPIERFVGIGRKGLRERLEHVFGPVARGVLETPREERGGSQRREDSGRIHRSLFFRSASSIPPTVSPVTGWRRRRMISHNGTRANSRSASRGCGTVSRSSRITSSS